MAHDSSRDVKRRRNKAAFGSATHVVDVEDDEWEEAARPPHRTGGSGAGAGAGVGVSREEMERAETIRQVRSLCAESSNPRSTWLNLRTLLKKLNDAGAGIRSPSGAWTKQSLCERLSAYLGLAPEELEIAATLPQDVLTDANEWPSGAYDPVELRVIQNAHRMRAQDGSQEFVFEGNPRNIEHYRSRGEYVRTRIDPASIRPDPLSKGFINAYALEAFGIEVPDEARDAERRAVLELQRQVDAETRADVDSRADFERWKRAQSQEYQRDPADPEYIPDPGSGASYAHIRAYLLSFVPRQSERARVSRDTGAVIMDWPGNERVRFRDPNDEIVWFVYLLPDYSDVQAIQMRRHEAQGMRYYPEGASGSVRAPLNPVVREVYRRAMIYNADDGSSFIPMT